MKCIIVGVKSYLELRFVLFQIEFSERVKNNSASFTEALMVFKFMKLHNTPFLFTKPLYMCHANRIGNRTK